MTHFYGNEISAYGKEHGYVDYRTLAKAFNLVLANEIILFEADYWECYNCPETEEDREVFQWYIVDWNGAEILTDADELVMYNDKLNLYVWGVTHYGTAWDYVLTNIKLED